MDRLGGTEAQPLASNHLMILAAISKLRGSTAPALVSTTLLLFAPMCFGQVVRTRTEASAIAQSRVASLSAAEVTRDSELIENFARSHDAEDLRKAFDPLAESLRLNGSDRPPSQPVVTLWMRLFAVVDAIQLEASNESHTVFMCSDNFGPVTTPPGPCGPPPSTVKDPKLRLEYEAAIAENRRAIEVRNNDGEIRGVKEQLDADFWTWANGLYRDEPDSEAKLLEEAKTVGCSRSRIEWVRDIMEAPSGSFPPSESIVLIPRKLKIAKGSDQISVRPDLNFPQGVQLVLDSDKTMGVYIELRVYPEGSKRPGQPDQVQISQISDFEAGMTTMNEPKMDLRVRRTGSSPPKRVVEEDFTIFETDVPVHPVWTPKNSARYTVLWRGAVSQMID